MSGESVGDGAKRALGGTWGGTDQTGVWGWTNWWEGGGGGRGEEKKEKRRRKKKPIRKEEREGRRGLCG